ncbi:Nitronate monooxygenase [compost metagenome]
MGTRFLMTKESPMPNAVKARYLSASELDTTLICRSIGDSTRVLKNALTDRILALEKAGTASHDDLMALASSLRWIQATKKDDPDDGAYAAGIGVGLIHEIPTCSELMQKIIEDARSIIGKRLAGISG